jgi:peptidoglycan hydrolase-like protein with peptidoglycan-binding domain
MRALVPTVAFLGLVLSGSGAARAQQSPAASVADGSPGTIAALQQQLRQEGYAPGPVNGVMTETTRRAIAAYARRTGHPPDTLAAAGGDPIKRVQAGLRALGLFAGPADGVVGPQTRDAIIRFEASRQLPIDPRISDRLLAELGPMTATTTAPSEAFVPGPSGSAPAAPGTGQTTAQFPEGATPEAFGRRQLPAWVNPPPIR